MTESINFWDPSSDSEKKLKEINTPEDFFHRVDDMNTQIRMFKMHLELKEPIEKLQALRPMLMTFEEAARSFGQKLSKELEENDEYEAIILFYNSIIKRLKEFTTKEELEKILEDSKRPPKEF